MDKKSSGYNVFESKEILRGKQIEIFKNKFCVNILTNKEERKITSISNICNIIEISICV